MMKQVLTIAGSDSGGGAGIQADIKTFQELGVYSTSVITAVTAQNTQGVTDIYPMARNAVEKQLDAIGTDSGCCFKNWHAFSSGHHRSNGQRNQKV
jgi:hydroxymethylpyrimidine/phosphomethylpyrimidine kinase